MEVGARGVSDVRYSQVVSRHGPLSRMNGNKLTREGMMDALVLPLLGRQLEHDLNIDT